MSPYFIFYYFLPLSIMATQDSKRLYDDLMFSYNLQIRPGESPVDKTTIYIRLSLSQIIELDEIKQIMMCSGWLRQTWLDLRLAWNPHDYGGVEVLHVPHEIIWVPDIVLFNAESAYNITISTKATIYSNGRVIWEPPAIFRSTCQINVQWFPFDEQNCEVKLGSWSYPKDLISLELIDNSGIVNNSKNSNGEIESSNGVDISDFYPSVEWDIMSLDALRSAKKYRGGGKKVGPFVDLTFELGLRRKTFFYTVNLLVPCISMAFLTLLVFYLPSDSGEKIQLSISILISLTFFFLLLTEMLPSSGLALPLIAKYLLFTMLMVSASVCVAVLGWYMTTGRQQLGAGQIGATN